MAKFSIIIPMYNSEKYISKCIESVLLQSYENFELILVNDGSTDNTYNICQEYLLKDNRIILLDKKNGGVSSARNMGIRKSSGNYIIFIDSDDFVETNLLYELNKTSNEYDSDVYMHSIDVSLICESLRVSNINSKYIYINKEQLQEIIPILIKKRYINQPWNKMYLSDIIKNNKILFDETLNLSEDALFNYEYYACINNLIIVNKNLYNYYEDSPGSLTNKYHKNRYDMIIYANDKLQELVRTNPNFKNSKSSADYIRLKCIYSSIFHVIANNDVDKEEEKNLYKKIYETNERFDIHNIDEISFKILAFIFNKKNEKLLKYFARIIYFFYRIKTY